MSSISKNLADIPPLLSKSKTCEHWLTLLQICHIHSLLTGPRKAAAHILSLQGDAQDVMLRVTEEEINKDDGVAVLKIKFFPVPVI